MAFSPALLLSHINSKEGLAKPCRYEVIIPLPQYINTFVSQSLLEQILNLPNTIVTDITTMINGGNTNANANPSMSRYLALQCENAELPGRDLITHDSKIYGPSYKVPYQTQFRDTRLSFMCTNDYYERKLFERWIECIMPLDTNNLRYAKDDATRYMTNIKIIQYDDFIKQIFAIELIDAFPVTIGSQQLSWQNEGYHKLDIQFAFQKYKVIYEGSYDLAGAALELIGAKAENWIDRTTGKLTGLGGGLFAKIL